MKTDLAQWYLIGSFITAAIGAALKLILVASSEYPRTVVWKRGEHVLAAVINLGTCFLIAYTLGWIHF